MRQSRETAPDKAPSAKSRSRRWGRLSFAAAAFAIVLLVPSAASAAPPPAFGWAAPSEDRTYEPAWDYDWDGCYPVPAIGWNGAIASGLSVDGSTGGTSNWCHDLSDLNNTNAYSRRKCDNGWCAYMYDLYFEKDQTTEWGCSECGHRNDWEHVVVWVHDYWPRYVSVSAHGSYIIRSRNDIAWDDTGTHPKVIYHKDGGGTHAFRFANFGEAPENHKGWWQFPPLMGWNNLSAGYRDKLVAHNFGRAVFGLKEGTFQDELYKAKPSELWWFNPWA